MKTAMGVILLAFAVSATGAAQQPKQQELITAVEELAQAQKRHDEAYIARILADDFLEIAGNGQLYNKAQVLEGFKNVELQEVSLNSFEVLPLGPNAAIVAYVADVKVMYAGQPLPARDYLNSTWVRRGGQWRLLFHQATPVPENMRKRDATCSIF